MRCFTIAIVLLTQVIMAGAALAVPVTVDFSVLGPPSNDPPLTVDITTAVNPAGLTLNGVRLSYDDFGSGVDFTFLDEAGVFGTTGGGLIFDFDTPATGLNADVLLLDAVSDESTLDDAMIAVFFMDGVFLDFASVAADFLAYDPANDPTLGFAIASLAYAGLAFDHVEMFMSIDAPFFAASNINYEPVPDAAPVPEPATFVLSAFGLMGLVGWRILRRSA